MSVCEQIANIYRTQRRNGLRVKDIRAATGLSSQTLQRICHGECSLSSAEILADYLGYRITIEEKGNG